MVQAWTDEQYAEYVKQVQAQQADKNNRMCCGEPQQAPTAAVNSPIMPAVNIVPDSENVEQAPVTIKRDVKTSQKSK